MLGLILISRLSECIRGNVLRKTVEYAIMMPHDVVLLPCLERVRSARNAEESTSCTQSSKIEPDSRGSSPGTTPSVLQQCGPAELRRGVAPVACWLCLLPSSFVHRRTHSNLSPTFLMI